MSEQELAVMITHANECGASTSHWRDVTALVKEVRRLQAQVADDSKFIAELQSELLSKRAEDVRPHDPGSPVRRGPSLFRVAAPDHVVGD